MKYIIMQGNEELNSNGGIALVGSLLDRLVSLRAIDGQSMGAVKKGWTSHSGILRSAIGLLSMGRSDFADIELFRNDRLFRDGLDISSVPSEETLRQRLDAVATAVNANRLTDDAVVELLSQAGEVGRETAGHGSYIPLDIDVSILDNSGSRKEETGVTYKNVVGYAPIFAHLGTNGYMLANELRPGTQHSAKGAVEFAERCLAMTARLGIEPGELLIRTDAGHDDTAFIGALSDAGVRFLVKRNLRRECPEQYLAMARRMGEKIAAREGKNVYRCILSHKQPAGHEGKPIFMVVEAVERLADPDGQPLLIPKLEISTWWTNLTEYEAACIQLYRNHATSEQYHSELKSDMGIERLPSGKFATNALFLGLSTIAFNCLRVIGQQTLRMTQLLPRTYTVGRRRLRSVMQDLIHVACKVVTHANRVFLKFGRNCPWYRAFFEMYARC